MKRARLPELLVLVSLALVVIGFGWTARGFEPTPVLQNPTCTLIRPYTCAVPAREP